MTENSSYEREKRRLKAELQDSKVYFFNQLRDEIELEERYSQFLPNRRVDDFTSFVDKQEFQEVKVEEEESKSEKESFDFNLSISDHITIPGLDTYEVLNTDHDSFI